MMLPTLTGMLLAAGCGGSPAPSGEDLARRACTAELQRELEVPAGDNAAATLMIGKRNYGWLVRGLSTPSGASGAQNFECRVDEGVSGSALTYLRLCAPGESPWGCPNEA